MPPHAVFLNRPLRRSDLRSRRAWQRTGIWAEIDRPLPAEDWVRLWVGSPRALVARFEFDNCRAESDERVLSLLGLLTPHLGQLLRRARVRAAAAGDAKGLTPRELEILSVVAEGRTNGELARILWISPNTVRKHLENAFDKLDVHTRTAAVARAFGQQPMPSNRSHR
jgi:DNA-binding CsgD family transcriptional regulator